MSKREKILDRLKQSPHNVTFDQIRKVLESESFTLERITGSHHMFKRGDILFAVPVHQNRVKSVYVKRVVEIIEKYGKS